MKKRLGVSERRACRVVGQPRGTQRYEAREADDEKPLVKRMRELSAQHPRYGYRRVWALLRGEAFGVNGKPVNRKRVHRLWRREGLRVPKRQRKRRRPGHGENGCTRRKAEHPDHVWSYDFVMDQTSDGKRPKLLPVVDEFTRECLAIDLALRLHHFAPPPEGVGAAGSLATTARGSDDAGGTPRRLHRMSPHSARKRTGRPSTACPPITRDPQRNCEPVALMPPSLYPTWPMTCVAFCTSASA